MDKNFFYSNSILTPSFIFDLELVEANIKQLDKICRSTFSHFRIFYSAKTNSLPQILSLAQGQGLGVSLASTSDLRLALEAGFKIDDMVVSGPNKKLTELLRSAGSATICIDSMEEVQTIIELKEELSRCRILIRLAHCVVEGNSRFGLLPEEAMQAYKLMRSQGIEISGVQVHAGSELASADVIIAALCRNINLIKNIGSKMQSRMIINIGGGMPSGGSDAQRIWSRFLFSLRSALANLEISLEQIILYLEPGRAIVENCGKLIGRVISVKSREDRRVIIGDVGTNLLRSNPVKQSRVIIYSIGDTPISGSSVRLTGPMCYETDLLSEMANLTNQVSVGDYFSISDVGAYNLNTAFPWIDGECTIYVVKGMEIFRVLSLVSEFKIVTDKRI